MPASARSWIVAARRPPPRPRTRARWPKGWRRRSKPPPRRQAASAQGWSRPMAYTIAIAGTSGAGKTSVARAVADALHSPVLHFDDYEYPDPASAYPDFEGWIAR